MSDAPVFLTVGEVAILLRVPRSRVYEWTRRRLIPAYKGCRAFTFEREEVLAWYKEQFAIGRIEPIRRRMKARRRVASVRAVREAVAQ